jgi:hypothetical protein
MKRLNGPETRKRSGQVAFISGLGLYCIIIFLKNQQIILLRVLVRTKLTKLSLLSFTLSPWSNKYFT